jgi:hypothetical protein
MHKTRKLCHYKVSLTVGIFLLEGSSMHKGGHQTAPTCLQNMNTRREKVRYITQGLVYPACIVSSDLASNPTILKLLTCRRWFNLRIAAEEITFLGHHVATSVRI